MVPAYKIDPPEWMRSPTLGRLMNTLNKDDYNARLVGGCIRNFFYKKPVQDIDIACKLSPKNVINICQVEGIKTIPTGLKHGTVKAHLNGQNFEITTLRQDIETDGRHAEVKPTSSWLEDAKRRDFTMNALYADLDGSIYDPLGIALDDIHAQKIRFIGDAEIRIQEDYLRILRYFRFYADFHEGEADRESFEACTNLKGGLIKLSDERIADEILKILSSNHAARALNLMAQADILGVTENVAEQVGVLIQLQTQLDAKNIYSRLYLSKINLKYFKNNKIIIFIHKIDEIKNDWQSHVKKLLYFYGRDIAVQALLILKSEARDISDMHIMQAVSSPLPVFPVTATDLMTEKSYSQGPELGKALTDLESKWIESDFMLNYQDLMDIL